MKNFETANYYINKNYKNTRIVIVSEEELANYPQIEFTFIGRFETMFDALEAVQE